MKGSKKITSKAMGADKESILELVMKDKKKEIPLYNVVGGAFEAKLEESENGMGEYIKLRGEFEAQSLIDGVIVESGVFIPPAIAGDRIAGKLMSAQSEDGERSKTFIQISLTITAKYDSDSATSYVFGVDFHNSDKSIFDELKELIPKQLQYKPSTKK